MATSGLWSHVSSLAGQITLSRTIGTSSWLDGLEKVNDNVISLLRHRQETLKWQSLPRIITAMSSSVRWWMVLSSMKKMMTLTMTMLQLSLLVRRSYLSLRLLQLTSLASSITIIPSHQVTIYVIDCFIILIMSVLLCLFLENHLHDILEIWKKYRNLECFLSKKKKHGMFLA